MKKIILGLTLGLLMLVGTNYAHAATTCSYSSPTSATCTDNTDRIEMFYYDAGSWGIYIFANVNSPLLINGTTAPMLTDPIYTHDLRIYSVDPACITGGHTTNTADPDFCGNLESTLPVSGNVFTGYVAPPVRGIGFFKPSYTAATFIGQTASAIQATTGINGFGKVLALIGGIILAFGAIVYVIGIIQETDKDKKLRKSTEETRKKI